MIRSMTGFGRSHVEREGVAVRVEARTVNNRSLRVNFRLPDCLQGLEPELERAVRGRISRGTVSVLIALDVFSGDPGYVIDEAAMKYYRDAMIETGRRLGMSGEVSMDTLAVLPGVIRKRNTGEEISEEVAAAVTAGLEQALAEVVEVRGAEGRYVWDDIVSHCERIAALTDKVEAQAPMMLERHRRRIVERLGPVLKELGDGIREEDVRREVAYFADRSDISEEISRLRSHLELMKGLETLDEPCGRRAEFIAQEMLREANTMASKANDAELVPDVLEIKSEVEKIREQALNVE